MLVARNPVARNVCSMCDDLATAHRSTHGGDLTPAERRVAEVVLRRPAGRRVRHRGRGRRAGRHQRRHRRAPRDQARLRRLRRAAGRGAGRARPAAAAGRRADPRGARRPTCSARTAAVELDNVRRHARRPSTATPSTRPSRLLADRAARCSCWPARRRAASACCSPTTSPCCAPASIWSTAPTCAWPAASPTCDAATCSSPSTSAATSAGCSTRRDRRRRRRAPASSPSPTAPLSPLADRAEVHVRRPGRGRRSVRQPRRHARPRQRPRGRGRRRLRRSATDRLDRIEAAWRDSLLDRTS